MAKRYNHCMQESADAPTFRSKVFLLVQRVPSGQVTTYGQIAAMIPPPLGTDPPGYQRVAAQWVGRAMSHAPEDLPWHRVINHQGRISLPAGSRAAAIQRMRLEAEGVQFDYNGRVALERFGWEGPDAAWLEEQGLWIAPPLAEPRPVQLDLFQDGTGGS